MDSDISYIVCNEVSQYCAMHNYWKYRMWFECCFSWKVKVLYIVITVSTHTITFVLCIQHMACEIHSSGAASSYVSTLDQLGYVSCSRTLQHVGIGEGWTCNFQVSSRAEQPRLGLGQAVLMWLMGGVGRLRLLIRWGSTAIILYDKWSAILH